jgi:hypothetical protein
MSFFWFRIILCAYIGAFLGSAMRHAFIDTAADSLRIGLQDLSITVLVMFIYCFTRFAVLDNEKPTETKSGS